MTEGPSNLDASDVKVTDEYSFLPTAQWSWHSRRGRTRSLAREACYYMREETEFTPRHLPARRH